MRSVAMMILLPSELPFHSRVVVHEESTNDRRELRRGGHEAQVTVVEDVESGVRNEAGHDSSVETGNDRVVTARQDQGGLSQAMQPVEARPAETGQELQIVAARDASSHLTRQSRRKPGV